MRARADELKVQLLESLSEIDDSLMGKYLDGVDIDEEEIKRVIRKGTLHGNFLPVLCGSAFKNKAIQPLLDAIVDYLPSPADVAPYKYWTEEGAEGELAGHEGGTFQRTCFQDHE